MRCVTYNIHFLYSMRLTITLIIDTSYISFHFCHRTLCEPDTCKDSIKSFSIWAIEEKKTYYTKISRNILALKLVPQFPKTEILFPWKNGICSPEIIALVPQNPWEGLDTYRSDSGSRPRWVCETSSRSSLFVYVFMWVSIVRSFIPAIGLK